MLAREQLLKRLTKSWAAMAATIHEEIEQFAAEARDDELSGEAWDLVFKARTRLKGAEFDLLNATRFISEPSTR